MQNCVTQYLRSFLCIALRIPTAHDFRVISARLQNQPRSQGLLSYRQNEISLKLTRWSDRK